MPKLKDIREERLMSQALLAHQAEVSSKTVSRIERGVGKTSLKSMQKIANALHVDPADIEEFQQWLDRYINDLKLSSDPKDSNQDRAGTLEQRLAGENEIEAEEIIIEDKYSNRLRPPPLQSKEEPQPEPEPKSNSEVEVARTTPVQVAKAVSNTSVEPKGNVTGVELGKVGMAGATLAPIGLMSTMSTKSIAILIFALVGIAIVYFIWRAQSQKETTKPRRSRTVEEAMDEY